ncbi:MAG TPA: site-2 protease family protein [Patescibacteria group bacterium]|nr:site-2 protease family protein [Patescibacteria group bacterium]
MFSQFSVQDIGIILASILIGMAFHEAMHAFTAHALGDTTARDQGRLTLNPLKHIDLMTTLLLPLVMLLIGLPPLFVAKPVPFNPDRLRYDEFGAALVALAGPLTNLVLAFVASLLIKSVGGDGGLSHALLIFIEVNVAFFVFNMIPLPPLDGSRVLYAFAPEPVQRAMYRFEMLGFGVTIVVLLVLANVLSPAIGHIDNAILTFLLR